MHKYVCAGLDAFLGIVDINFDIQGAGRRIDRVGITNDLALEYFIREFIESQCSFGSDSRRNRIDLRHRNVDAQTIYRRHMEEFLWYAACSGIDQRTNVRVSCGD